MKIKFTDEMVDKVVVKELKRAYKITLESSFLTDDDKEDLKAIEIVLRYYMGLFDSCRWLKKQKGY